MARPGNPPGGVPLKSAVQAFTPGQSNQMNANLFPVTAYPADGAIAAAPGIAILSKAGVGAYTLAAPPADGIRLVCTSTTANAHVITATGLLNDGLTGAPHNTFTFAAFPGASVEFISYAGKWQEINHVP